MKSSFLEKSKRALVLLLTGAMIATSVPSNAFAATVADTDDVIIEEVTDAVAQDAVVEEEVVADEPSDVVEALGAEEPVEGETEYDSTEALDAGTIVVNHVLNVYEDDAAISLAMANDDTGTYDIRSTNGTAAAETAYRNLAYASEMTTRTYTVKADYNTGDDQDYTNLEWIVTKDAPKTTETLTDNKADLPTGFNVAFSGATVTISGRPMSYLAADTQFYIVAIDKDDDPDAVSLRRVVIPMKVGVATTVITAKAKNNTTNGALEDKIAGTLYFDGGTDGAKVPTKMGYTRYTTDPANAGVGNVPMNVKPIKITLEGSGINTDYPIPVEITLAKGEEESPFEIQGVEYTTGADGKLGNNKKVVVTVVPKDGLTAAAGNVTYTDKLVIGSNTFAPNAGEDNAQVKIVNLSFTVTTNLSITAKNGDTEIEKNGKTGANNTGDQIALGSIQVGKPIEDVTFVAAGGKGNVKFQTIDKTKFPDGLTFTATEGDELATVTVSGTPSAKAYTYDGSNATVAAATTYGDMSLTAEDSKASTAGPIYYTVNVKPADVAFTDSEGLTLANMGSAEPGYEQYGNSFVYAWGVGYKATTTKNAATSAKFKISNNSQIPLTINVAKAGTNAADFGLPNTSFTIAKEDSVDVTVNYPEGILDDTESATAYLTFTGNGVKKTVIGLTVTCSGTDKIITTSLKDGEVGQPYKAKLEAVGEAGQTWSLISPGISAADLRDTWGLTLDIDNGVIEGTPKKAGAITLKLKKGSTEGTGTITLNVAKATNKAVSFNNGATSLKLADQKIDTQTGDVGTITVTNKTTVNLGKMTASISAVAPINGTTKDKNNSSSNFGQIAKFFKLKVLKPDGTVSTDNTFDLNAGENYSFTIENIAPGSDDSLIGIGTYMATVKVKNNDTTDDSLVFPVTVKVDGNLIVNDASVNTTNLAGKFKVGQKVDEIAGYSAADFSFGAKAKTSNDPATDATAVVPDEVTFTWENYGEATDPKITESGLKLSDKVEGLISGTPVKAGLYKAKVIATGQGKYAGMVGEKIVTINVNGSATLTLAAKNVAGSPAVTSNNVVVLNGKAVGDTIANTDGIQIEVTATNAPITKGLNIKVESVDTRTESEKASKPDLHANSDQYIGLSTTSIATIAKDGTGSFTVKPLKTDAKKDALVKVTLSGDEATTEFFYVEYVVSDMLTVDPLSDVESAYGAATRIQLNATADDNTSIAWYENQKKAPRAMNGFAKGDVMNNIVNTQDVDADSDGIFLSASDDTTGVTGLGLFSDTGATLDGVNLEASDRRAWIGSAARTAGYPDKKGSFDVYVTAKTTQKAGVATALTSANNTTAAKEFIKDADGTDIARNIKNKADKNLYDAGGVNNVYINLANMFKVQDATQSFKLTVGGSNALAITDLVTSDNTTISDYSTGAAAAALGADLDNAGSAISASALVSMDKTNNTEIATAGDKSFSERTAADRKSDGIWIDRITGYTFHPRTSGDAFEETATITIKNTGGLQLTGLTSTLKNTASAFEVDTPITATLGSNATCSIAVSPKTATLSKVGVYEDVLLIKGTNLETIEFPISLTVEKVNYAIDVYQRGSENLTTVHDADFDTVIVEKDTTGTSKAVAEITLNPIKKGTVSYSPAALPDIFIRNSGNKDTGANVTIKEVKDANGTSFITAGDGQKLLFAEAAVTTADKNATGATLTLANAITIDDTTPEAAVYVRPADTSKGGNFKAYLQITYASGKSVIVTVNYTIHNTSLDGGVYVTPETNVELLKNSKIDKADHTAEALAKRYYTENYDPAALKTTFVIDNKDNKGDEANALYNVVVTLDDPDFQILYDGDDAILANPLTLVIGTIAPEGRFTFDVAPVSGLVYSDTPWNDAHSTTVTISSDSISTPFTKVVSLPLIAGTDFSIDLKQSGTTATTIITDTNGDGTGTAIPENAKVVQRLYNSIVLSGKYANNTTPGGALTLAKPIVVNAGLDVVTVSLNTGNETVLTDDIVLVFTLASAADNATLAKLGEKKPIKLEIAKASSNSIPTKSFTVSVNDTQKNTAATNADYSYDETYTNMTFNLFSPVTFDVSGTGSEYVESVTEMYNDNLVIKAKSAPDDDVIDETQADAIVAWVPNTTKLGTVFNEGKLPSVIKANTGFTGWFSVALGADVDANTVINSDITATPKFAPHKYTTNPNDTTNAIWAWNQKTNGDWTATLTLKCIDENGCPDPDGSKVVLTDVTSPSIDITITETKATCDTGSGKTYNAKVIYGGTTFTSKKTIENGSDTALGHDWTDAVVTWGEAKDDGSYDSTNVKVKRTCKTDPTHIAELTIVSVNENEKVAPTCDTDGSVTYTITYTDVDKYGKPAGNVTTKIEDGKKAVLKAKGHNKTPELTVENFDETTLKANVTATCPDCHKELFKGELTATANEAEGNYTFTFTSPLDSKTYTVSWSNHEHNWSAPVWAWLPDNDEAPTSATATFTCSVGKESKTVTASITSEKDGDQYIDYTAKVTFNGQDYTDVITIDAVTGKRTAKHEHVWKTDKKWTWDPATGVPTSASLTFTCTVGDKPETKTVTGSAVAGTPNKKGAIKYTVEVTGPDGMPYSTSKTIDASGQEVPAGGNYEDDAEEDGTFTASFENDETEYVYTGSAIKPNVIVNNGEKTLVNGVDYTLGYKNNTNVGTATVTVKGKGLYTSTLDLDFAITKASIADAAIGNLAYKTGTASDKIKPTANYKGKALKLGTDFAIKSMGEIDSTTNTQTLTIVGAGTNFDADTEQEVTITYAAKPAKINATINVAKSYAYTGEEVLTMDALRDLVTVTGLAEGANFYVTAGDLVNAGTCKIAVTADGFTGTKTASFKIDPAKNATFTVTNAEDLTTTGTKFKVAGATPFVAVNAKINDDIDHDLVLGKDYKVTYSKNKEAGTGTAKIAFLGNYKGAKSIDQTFKINKASLEDGIVSAADFVKGKNAASKAYMAAPDKKLFVSIDGMQIKKSEYAVTYKQGDTVLTGKNDITFESGEATITVEIAPSAKAKSVEAGTTPLTGEYKVFESVKGTDVSKGKVTVVSGGKTAKIGYTGTAITFAQDDTERQGDLSLKIGKTVVSASDIEEHFDITYVNNVNKGKATVILTAKDGDETYTGSATGTFTIGAHVFNKAKDIKD